MNRCFQPREYQLFCDNNEDFDEVIREWMNFRFVLQVDMHQSGNHSNPLAKLSGMDQKLI
jgi:hypothetical protein